jgi:hypothetical protein
MEIMNAHNIKTPACYVAETPEEAENIFTHKLNTRKCLSRFGNFIGAERDLLRRIGSIFENPVIANSLIITFLQGLFVGG